VIASFSIIAESFGRTIIEAMAARQPVIAYASGATPELIRHGKDGFLIPPADLAKALEHLGTLADSPHRVLEMGRNAREQAERLFSPDVFTATLNGIYRQIFDHWQAQEPLLPAIQGVDASLQPPYQGLTRSIRKVSSP
jgi:glycosyltransferase involved in cell wall biosynthesis